MSVCVCPLVLAFKLLWSTNCRFYVHRIFGLSNDDYDYKDVNRFVHVKVKTFIKQVGRGLLAPVLVRPSRVCLLDLRWKFLQFGRWLRVTCPSVTLSHVFAGKRVCLRVFMSFLPSLAVRMLP